MDNGRRKKDKNITNKNPVKSEGWRASQATLRKLLLKLLKQDALRLRARFAIAIMTQILPISMVQGDRSTSERAFFAS